MKLIAKGIRFTLTGTLYPEGMLAYRKLQKIGKEVSFSGKTEVLIHEKSPSRKPDKARDKGIPVIDQAQLITLVETGSLTIESELDAPDGSASIDELLGEVRGLVSEHGRSEAWDALCKMVDACLPEHQEMLIDYIDSYLQRLDIEDQLLCVAPHAWLLQMMEGQQSPKYRLLRALDFFGQKHTGTKALKALKCESLVNLKSLNLHVNKDLTKTLMKNLHTLPSCQNLIELGMGNVKPETLAPLLEGDGLRGLERFIWCDNSVYLWHTDGAGMLTALRKSPLFENVTKISIDRSHLWRLRDKSHSHHLDWFSEKITHLDFSRISSVAEECFFELIDATEPTTLTVGFGAEHYWVSQSSHMYPDSIERVQVKGMSAVSKKKHFDRLKSYQLPGGKIDIEVRGYAVDTISQCLALMNPKANIS